jgi:hypothetical protein
MWRKLENLELQSSVREGARAREGSLPLTAFETIAQELGSELVKKGFEVYVSCESKRSKIKPYGNYQGVRLAYFPVINGLRNLSRFQAYMKLVQ